MSRTSVSDAVRLPAAVAPRILATRTATPQRIVDMRTSGNLTALRPISTRATGPRLDDRSPTVCFLIHQVSSRARSPWQPLANRAPDTGNEDGARPVEVVHRHDLQRAVSHGRLTVSAHPVLTRRCGRCKAECQYRREHNRRKHVPHCLLLLFAFGSVPPASTVYQRNPSGIGSRADIRLGCRTGDEEKLRLGRGGLRKGGGWP